METWLNAWEHQKGLHVGVEKAPSPLLSPKLFIFLYFFYIFFYYFFIMIIFILPSFKKNKKRKKVVNAPIFIDN